MNDSPRRRMRSASVVLGMTALAAATLSGCADDDVCVDQDTGQEVSDAYCEDDYSGTYIWYNGSGSRRYGGSSSNYGGSSSDYGGSSSHYGGSTDYGGFGGSSGGISG